MLKKIVMVLTVILAAFGLLLATTGQSEFSVADSAVVAATPARAWPLLAGIAAWPQWWPGMVATQLTPALQPGARLDIVLQGDAERRPATVEAVVPERKLSWVRDGVLGSTTRTALLLAAVPTGTRVTLQSTIRGPQSFLARLTSRDQFSAYHRQVLEELIRQLNPGGEDAAAVTAEGA